MGTPTSTSPSRAGPAWGGALFSAVAAVSWGFLAMAGTAALGLHLLGADTAGSLGPMTAAVVVMASGGRVSPSGDVSVLGLGGAGAQGAIGIMPLGVGLAGALGVGWVFVRSLRGRGPAVSGGELAARAGAVAVFFVALLAGLAWAGQDTVAVDGVSLGGAGTGGGGTGGGGGLLDQLRDGLGDVLDPSTSVSFHVEVLPSLLGGLGWVAGVLVIALLVSRRTPLPRGLAAAHVTVRPAASALCTVLLLAVAAGFAAAGYAALTDDDPGRIMGAALLGAPNGVWLAVPLGLFVRWEGAATGALVKVLPDPLDQLLSGRADEPVTPGRLAALDHRFWLLTVAASVLLLTAGALTAARTPLPGARWGAYAGRCALRLALVTAAAFPLLVWLTGVSVDADLAVFGVNAVDAGLDLHGSLLWAVLLGAAWGAGAGGAGALLALATGAAGQQASPYASGRPGTAPGPGPGPGAGPGAGPGPGSGAGDSARTYPGIAYRPGPYIPSPVYRPGEDGPNPYKEPPRPG